MALHYQIQIFGKVQGVGFRYYARSQAQLMGITGFVRNEFDGSVLIEAEGTKEALDTFVEWCRKGPERARVKNIEVLEAPVKNFTSFQVV